MGGSTKQTSNTNSTTQTNPWDPAIPQIGGILNNLNTQVTAPGATGVENYAITGLMNNAQNGNPYAGSIGNVASNLLQGGGPDRSGYTTSGLNQLQSSLTPIANQSTNPFDNQTYQNLQNTLTSDITDRIKSQYAGAGYSPTGSGDFGYQMGRGISAGVAPAFEQAQNDLTTQRANAANSLYSGGANTTGILSGLDQTRLGNQQAGIGASQAALQANDSPYNQILNVQQQARNLPLQNIGNTESLLLPIAQLGGTSNTNATTESQTQVPMGQQILGGLLGGAGLIGGMGGFGANGWLYGNGASGNGLLNGLFKAA